MSNVWSNNLNLYEDYLKLLQSQKIEEVTPLVLNRFDQIHAGGLKATEKLSSMVNLTGKELILEIGGGVGGVARFLANRFNTTIINLDLSSEYTLTGKKLTELCKISDKKIFFLNADANHCPFKSSIFDIVWLQHVNMNISNKERLISELARVLKNEGKLAFHEWFMYDDTQNIPLPLPWADENKHNHLCSFNEFVNILNSFNFKITHLEDETENSLLFYNKLLQTKAFLNPIFKNRAAKEIFENAARVLEGKKMQVFLGVAVLNIK